MPQAFEDCVRRGGRVRTKTLPDGRYIHICFIDGKSYAGEVKTPKSNTDVQARREAIRRKRMK